MQQRPDRDTPEWMAHLAALRLASDYQAEGARLAQAPIMCAWCEWPSPECHCEMPPALHHLCGVCGMAEAVRERESRTGDDAQGICQACLAAADEYALGLRLAERGL